MDPQTLAPAARALYDRIKSRYQVTFEPLKIGTHRLHLLKIADWEQILEGRDPMHDVASFPFWIRLWEAAIVLSEYIAGMPVDRNASVLELGAGLGAPGLTAASAGFQVTLSDYEELILDFERVNAAASGLDNVDCLLLDWRNPPPMPRYDMIVGAEIFFREEFLAPLLDVLRIALKPEGAVYLAHDERRQSLRTFLKMAEKEYSIAMSRRRLKGLDGDKHILLTRLQPRR